MPVIFSVPASSFKWTLQRTGQPRLDHGTSFADGVSKANAAFLCPHVHTHTHTHTDPPWGGSITVALED